MPRSGPKAAVDYEGYNASPSGVAETSTPGGFSVRANPDDMGAQVGRAEEGLGQTGNKIASDASNLALQYQGKINESLATDTETKYVEQLGQKTAKFRSLEGLAAVNAAPQYTAEVAQMRSQMRGNLPNGAMHAFDMLAQRHEAYAINDANLYVAQQIKHASITSAQSQIQMSIANAGSLPVAMDDKRFDENLRDIHFGQGHMMQTQGWDSGTGMQENQDGTHSFDETTEMGKGGKSVYEELSNKNISDAWENRLKTIADNGNVMQAYDKYKENYDRIPPNGRLKMDQYFAPKIKDFQARSISENVLSQHTTNYNDQIYGKVSSIGSADAAIAWTRQHEGGFVSNDGGKGPSNFGINQEANPDVDVSKLTQDQADKIMHDKYWVGIGADKMSPAMGAVAFDTAVNMGVGGAQKLIQQSGDDPQKLIDLRRDHYEMLADKDPARYGKYLEGWNKRLDDLEGTLGKSNGMAEPSNGKTVPSVADYYKSNYAKILDQSRDDAEKQFPGDITFAEKTEARTKQRMDAIIQQDKLATEASQDTVLKALNGDFNKGTQPQTVDELVNTSPEVKKAWDSLMINNPKAAEVISNKMVGAKKKGDLGNGFSYIQQDVLHNKMNINELLYHVDDGTLSQEGFDKLKPIALKNNISSGERSDADQIADFFKAAHTTISHSSLFGSTKEAETAFQNWHASVEDQINKKINDPNDKIPLSQLITPGSKDYVGGDVKRFVAPMHEQLDKRAERINARIQTAQPISEDKKRLPNETPEQYLARVK